MKTKLLKKVKKKIKMYKRNNFYFIETPNLSLDPMDKDKALSFYREYVLHYAHAIFGFRPKERVK
jgi:hypothetical protein